VIFKAQAVIDHIPNLQLEKKYCRNSSAVFFVGACETFAKGETIIGLRSKHRGLDPAPKMKKMLDRQATSIHFWCG
jgi:hypothetical protein